MSDDLQLLQRQAHCQHLNFAVTVTVNRLFGRGDLTDTGGMPTGYMAEITIKCADCELPFSFKGLPCGSSRCTAQAPIASCAI